MQPGHPHLTKELDTLRTVQRFELSCISDDVFRGDDDWRGSNFLARSPITFAAPVAASDRQLAEPYLRQKALDLRAAEPDLAEYLDAVRRAAPAHATAVVLRACEFASGVGEKVLGQAAEEFYEHDPHVPDRARRHITEYVTLLAMADAVADDGYHDARIAATEHGEAEAA
jgi:hypothetical protein